MPYKKNYEKSMKIKILSVSICLVVIEFGVVNFIKRIGTGKMEANMLVCYILPIRDVLSLQSFWTETHLEACAHVVHLGEVF